MLFDDDTRFMYQAIFDTGFDKYTQDLTELDNRFSTMTEVRRVLWPDYEAPQWSPARFQQGIQGSLELFFRSWTSFQRVVEEATGHVVPVFQRVDQAGY